MSVKQSEGDGPKSTSTGRAEEAKQRAPPRGEDEPAFKHRARSACFITDYFAASNSNEQREESRGEEDAPALLELRARLLERDAQLERREEEVQRLAAGLEAAERRLQSYEAAARRALARAMLELERARLREEWEEIACRQRRLGAVRSLSASRSLDDWLDGVELLRLKDERQRVQAELEELGGERRSARGRRAPEDDSRAKLRGQQQSLAKRADELEREIARLNAEKFELVHRQRRFADNSDCSMASARPDGERPAWPCVQQFQFLSLIGRGGFSEVYKAYDLAELRYVVCKVHQLNAKWEPAVRENYLRHTNRENAVFQRLRHPHIVGYFGTLELDALSCATVLEYCEGPDLDYLLKRQGALPEREARAIARQLFLALKYLAEQSPRVIHYDVKPQNILFARGGAAKLTDFGLCKLFEGEESKMELTSQGSGTYWYLPPESFEGGAASPRISPKLDVWSAGVVLYQMLYGRRPFGHSLSQERVQRERVILRSTAVVFPEKPAVSAETKELVRRCLAYDQDARLDAQGALAMLERP